MLVLGRSDGTVVNSYDLTTCPSWVQAPNGPIRRTDYPAMVINKSLKVKLTSLVGTDRP